MTNASCYNDIVGKTNEVNGRNAVHFFVGKRGDCMQENQTQQTRVATADEVATVVHQIFAYTAGACC